MSGQDANANVVVSADVSGYQQGMAQATTDTNTFMGTVNKLSASLDGITKRAGKKITLFAAADLATMAGFTALAANYQKQLKTIDVTLVKGGESLNKYSDGIKRLTVNSAKSRGEIVDLTLQIRQMGVASQTENEKMAKTFLNLSKATNSSLPAITQSMMELSRSMGTLNSGDASMNRFANSLVTVSQRAGVSAEGVAQFANSIAPIGRVAGITETQLLGFSAAFNKAGADGFMAANTFNTMLAEITRQVQNGSPELSKYSSMLGMTMEQFSQMDPAERILKIFQAIQAAGPLATRTLDNLGFDGIRAARALQAVAAESGGLQQALNDANAGYNGTSGITAEDQATRGKSLEDALLKSKNIMQEFGTAIGDAAVGPMNALVDGANKLMGALLPIVTPIATIAGSMLSMVGYLGMMAGPMLMMMGWLGKIALVGGITRMIGNSQLRMGYKDAQAGREMSTEKYNDLNRVQKAGRDAGVYLGSRSAETGGGGILRTAGRAAFAGTMRTISAGSVLASGMYEQAGGLREGNKERGFVNQVRQGYRAFIASDSIGKAGLTTYADRARQAGINAVKEENAARLDKGQGPLSAGRADSRAAKATRFEFQRLTKDIDLSAKSAGTLGGAFKELGKALTRDLQQGIKNTTHGVGVLSKGLMSFFGPQMLAMMGIMAGVSLYSAWNSRKEGVNAAAAEKTPITAGWDAALGESTAAVVGFTESVKTAAEIAKASGKTALEILNEKPLLNEQNRADRSEYQDKNVENMNANSAIGYIKAQGDLTPQRATLIKSDMLKRFGMDSPEYKQVLDAINGSSKEAGPAGVSTGAGAAMTVGSFQKWMSENSKEGGFLGLGNITNAIGGLGGPNDLQSQSLREGYQGYKNEAAPYTKWGESTGRIANAGAEVGFITQNLGLADKFDSPESIAFNKAHPGSDPIRSLQGESWKIAAGRTLEQQDSKLFGDGKGLKLVESIDRNPNDVRKGIDEFINSTDPKDQEEFRLHFAEFTNNWVDTLKDMTKNAVEMSATEKQFTSTKLGKLIRGNTAIMDSITGSKTTDPVAMQESGKLTAQAALSGAGGNKFGDTSVGIKNLLKQTDNMGAEDIRNLNTAITDLQKVEEQRMATASPLDKIQSQLKQAAAFASAPSSTGQADYLKQAESERAGALASFMGFIQQMAQAQKDFDLNRLRSQEDFNLQMAYGEEDFRRQQRQSNEDFLRGRNRDQVQYDKQLKRSIEDAAKTIYDPYKRVQAQATSSTAALLANLKDQNAKIMEQTANLAKLKEMGLSQQTIDTLGLASPDRAQQAARMVTEGGANFGDINSATALRGTATQGLLQNDANSDWTRQQEDRKVQLDQQVEDFERGMNRSENAYERSVKRANEAQAKSMARALEDFGRMYDTVTAKNAEQMQAMFEKTMSWTTDNLGPAVADKINTMMLGIAKDLPGKFADAFPVSPKGINPNTILAPIPSYGTNQQGESTAALVAPPKVPARPAAPTAAPIAKPESDKRKAKAEAYAQDIYTAQLMFGSQERAQKLANSAYYKWLTDHPKKYATGGIFTRAQTGTIGEAGPEAVIPLNSQGQEFMTDLMIKAIKDADATTKVAQQQRLLDEVVKGMVTSTFASPHIGAGTTTIQNNTTNFKVEKIVTQDVNDMARQLKQKARLQSLRKPAGKK